jgi:hypothetical protein
LLASAARNSILVFNVFAADSKCALCSSLSESK